MNNDGDDKSDTLFDPFFKVIFEKKTMKQQNPQTTRSFDIANKIFKR